MLSVDEALEQVLSRTPAGVPEHVPLASALGQTLAGDVQSDVDSPPHDKSLVDGFAVRAEDIEAGIATFEIVEEVTAGNVPTQTVSAEQATRIMTGAPIPAGADSVIMVEESRTVEPTRVALAPPRFSPGQNIMRQGTSMKVGDRVLSAGRRLRAIDIGMLAEVGQSDVLVSPHPKVGILATGDELVTADRQPAAGQIRNSNGPMLEALVRQAGGHPVALGVARDERADLQARIERGLECDFLVLSGGVSAGVLDLVPSVLEYLQVRQVFHRIHLRPGKPLWFGTADASQTLVFGLPGNPVSSLVCFELFVRPAILSFRGESPGPSRQSARLAKPHSQRGDRPTYFPASLHGADVTPLNWKGSADLRTLVEANCLCYFPPGTRDYAVGEEVEVCLQREFLGG